MIVIGIGGLHNAIGVKRELWPGLSERDYNATQGRDAAAALVVDGEVVAAAAEERFSRKKHDGDFPVSAVEYCLQQAGVRPDEVDEVAHCFRYERVRAAYSRSDKNRAWYGNVLSREALIDAIQSHVPELARTADIHCVDHHLAHAASTFYACGWNRALVMVTDWMGEAESLTLWRGENGRLEKLHAIGPRHSLGALYSLVTFHLGFFNHDEYKVMGLAPYGDPARFREVFADLVQLLDDGSVRIHCLGRYATDLDHQTHRPVLDALVEALGPQRARDEPLEQVHRDISAALQERLAQALLHVASFWARATGMRSLALAGGVALNCSATGYLRRSGVFEDIFVQPASSDDGAALGAALHRASVHGKAPRGRMPVPYLGPAHSQADRALALQCRAGVIDVQTLPDEDAVCAEAARRLARGEVIAWYHDRMEFGPRALGNRSILADPRRPDIRDRVNKAVKKREAFRPFAPAVTLEAAHEIFDVEPGQEFPYMTEAAMVRPAYVLKLPGTTHVDGSARLQTVSRETNPRFHRLLTAFEDLSGIPALLNTSFNVNEQPIVNTPLEAIDTLLMTEIDALFLENDLVTSTERSLHRAAAGLIEAPRSEAML
jgi:carbamoyltransferase